jgi:hypothetical protein
MPFISRNRVRYGQVDITPAVWSGGMEEHIRLDQRAFLPHP